MTQFDFLVERLHSMKSSSKNRVGVPMTQPHCDHEVVCSRYIGTGYWYNDMPCSGKSSDSTDCPHDTRKTPAPAAPEKVMLCFGDYWECPIDEEECKVSDVCHQRAIQNREHDATTRNQMLDDVSKLLGQMASMEHHVDRHVIRKIDERIKESLRTPSTQEHTRGDAP